MKKALLVSISIGFVLLVVVGRQQGWFGSGNPESFPKLPEEADFEVSQEFDGQWQGRRIDVTGNNLCERTTMAGTVKNGFAKLVLTYNGTLLQGWIDTQGNLQLYANNRQWDYRFSAQVVANQIEGRWFLTNGPCKGIWMMRRQ
ncbi:hypothetical protein [Vibrio fluminensis]|uniref:hypothetical protein n=1 Tax=Vibrio fluminensis TaxID=2783614 RepID=UPI00188871D0|nr:hypothetical protein [Vibrio fluminensis]